MSTSIVIVVVLLVLIVVVVVGALVLLPMMRRRKLQSTFGPEYDRVIDERGDRAAAEAELRERQERHRSLDLREIPEHDRARYAQQWAAVQERFVDDPHGAVRDADGLVTTVMAARGYPTQGFEQQLADLSIEHSTTLGHYRDAHEVNTRASAGHASTEDLRGAMVHYRTLFAELLGDDVRPGHTRAASADRLDDRRDDRNDDRRDDRQGHEPPPHAMGHEPPPHAMGHEPPRHTDRAFDQIDRQPERPSGRHNG